MVVGSDQVYGRKPVIRIVRELMAREEADGSLRNQRFPILVVEGFRGAGKTALLAALDELLDQRVPYARLDLEANRNASIPEVLSALAFELSRKCPRYGVLQFPRFIIGQLVIGLELDLTDRERARAQVEEELEHQRGADTVRDMFVKTAGDVLETLYKTTQVPVVPLGTYLFERVLKRLIALVPRRIVLGSFQDWYRHQDLGLNNDSIDVLVNLNRDAKNAKQRVDNAQQQVDDLLRTAFLADLRADFDCGRRADERSLNCVVLLDNADTVLGRRFLDGLVRARRQRVAGGRDDADPLTVVATSRGALLAGIPSSDRASRSADRSRLWWRQYQLPDLTEDEVGWMVAALGLAQVDNQRLTRVVFQLTGGHPASTQLVLDAIGRTPLSNVIEPEVTLGLKPSGEGPHSSPTVEGQILDRLLSGFSDVTSPDSMIFAAAREQRDALVLSAQKDLVVGDREYPEIIDMILWPAGSAAGPALLRRLLQRRLALRASVDPPCWSDVFERLRNGRRTDARRTKDEAGELYYALASGDLSFVVQQLYQRITEFDDKRWLTLLKSVTTAPRQHRQRQALLDEVRTLVLAAEPEQPLTSLTRLIAALWIAADPFIDSDRSELHDQIAAQYTEVAQLAQDGPSAVLLREARWHRAEAEWWA